MTRRAGARLLLAGSLALLCGCGLPLASGVQRPGEVRAEQQLPQPISVLPPGPQPRATPAQIVLGYLAAQGSARDDHGIARSFLEADARASWRSDAGVTVYAPLSVKVGAPVPVGDGTVAVTVGLDVVGAIDAAGHAQVQDPEHRSLRVRLRAKDGQWRLVEVPEGLVLTPASRARAFDPASIYFLAPPGTPGSATHLAPDLVQVPADRNRAQEVVSHLLQGPSAGLAGSVSTAVPPGARLREPTTTSPVGLVTVDLTGVPRGLAGLSAQTRRDLSAQLVWTLRDALPDFTRLRLLLDGRPVPVQGVDGDQPRTAWAAYDPDGSVDQPSGIAVVDGQLRSLAADGDDRAAPVPAPVSGVQDVAVDPRHGRLAVLTAPASGTTRTVSTGRFSGPLTPVLADPGLRSPSWGSGELGLWLLRAGPRPAVLLLPDVGAGVPAPVEVQVDDLPPLSDDAELRVSRDGTRVALVSGGVLSVGRLELGGRRPHLVGLHQLATGVRDVAWRSGTVLEALVDDTEPPLLPLLRISVDGTVSQLSGLVGVAEGVPTAIAAYGDSPLLVATTSDSRSTVYTGGAPGGVFEVRLRDALRPSYPPLTPAAPVHSRPRGLARRPARRSP